MTMMTSMATRTTMVKCAVNQSYCAALMMTMMQMAMMMMAAVPAAGAQWQPALPVPAQWWPWQPLRHMVTSRITSSFNSTPVQCKCQWPITIYKWVWLCNITSCECIAQGAQWHTWIWPDMCGYDFMKKWYNAIQSHAPAYYISLMCDPMWPHQTFFIKSI